MWEEKILFPVESYVFAGKEFESKCRLYKFPRLHVVKRSQGGKAHFRPLQKFESPSFRIEHQTNWIAISFPELRSPWPAVGKRELWEHPNQACAIACHRCRLRLRSEPDKQNSDICLCYFKMDIPRALVLRPLVKGNEALGMRLTESLMLLLVAFDAAFEATSIRGLDFTCQGAIFVTLFAPRWSNQRGVSDLSEC